LGGDERHQIVVATLDDEEGSPARLSELPGPVRLTQVIRVQFPAVDPARGEIGARWGCHLGRAM